MIGLGMIVKGTEWEQTKRALASVEKYVDNIYITTTKEKIHHHHPKVNWSHFDWNDSFSDARNFNFSQIKDEYVLWIDSDDVVINGATIPKVVKEMNKRDLDAVFADYNYEIDPVTRGVVIAHPRERIVKRTSYWWKGELHETLIPKNKTTNTQYIKDFYINHYPTQENRDEGIIRNYHILANAYKREVEAVKDGTQKEIDPRTEYYLARILFDMKTKESHHQAFNLFQDYLEHSGWDEERAQAWNYLGNILYNEGNYEDSINCYLTAVKERPEYPTWYAMLGRAYAALKDFDKAEYYANRALEMKQPSTSMVIAPRDNVANAYLTLFFVYFNKKMLQKSLDVAEKLYQLIPDKENKERVKSIEKLIRWGKWVRVVGEMSDTLSKQGELDKLRLLLTSIPEEIANTMYVSQIKNHHLPPEIWPEKSIAYYAATDLEPWTPKNLDQGIGGSEEAIIYLSREWVKLGYKVVVFTNTGADEGVYDGVEYRHYHRFNHKDQFDVLIGWRNPLFFKNNVFNARLILLDLHDDHYQSRGDFDIWQKVDYLMVKSMYQRERLPDIPDHKFIVVGNGIDVEMLAKVKVKKKRYKVFYGSSYNRGLETILEMWPEIRKAEPLAELHICYGWQTFDSLLSHNPYWQEWKRKIEVMMQQDGIVHHGRMGKKELYEIAGSCGVWAYPTNFEEISCITGMYCQALGTIPVYYNYAALQETVKYGESIEPGNKQKYLETLINTIKNPKDYQKSIETAQKRLSWSSVANEWINIFKQKSEDIKVSIITPTIRTGWWNLMAHNLSQLDYQNFEWIIVDDYKENRESIAKKYAQTYNLEIKYLRGKPRTTKRNYKLINANNTAIQHATGQVCLWLQDFILLPQDCLSRVIRHHKRYPNDLIAPVDVFNQAKHKPDMTNKEDWWNGEVNVVGKLMRKNVRIGKGGLWESENPFDFEMNVGAIPTHIVKKLNGFYEFFDDALGYDNTDIAYRAMSSGSKLWVDECNVVTCIDHWKWLEGTDENGKDREWNLNDPRFYWMVEMVEARKLPLVRDEVLDNKISLKYEIPRTETKEGAVKYMKKRLEALIKQWKEEYSWM